MVFGNSSSVWEKVGETLNKCFLNQKAHLIFYCQLSGVSHKNRVSPIPLCLNLLPKSVFSSLRIEITNPCLGQPAIGTEDQF